MSLDRLDEAMLLLEKQETIALELGIPDRLRWTYGSKSLALAKMGRLDEAIAFRKKEEAICLAQGFQLGLANCYRNWDLLAQEQDDRKTAREMLERALAIYTELKQADSMKDVKSRLDELDGNNPPGSL